jgi:DNA-binding response OmpR family regulator
MPPPSNAHVLVVEDEPFLSELVATRLMLAGYQVAQARDGLEALDCLRQNLPEAIVLDINMPRLDGFGVLEHMRKHARLKIIPTMVLTARNRTEDVRKAMQLGARDYLTKPFEDRALLMRVARLVRRSAIGSRMRG